MNSIYFEEKGEALLERIGMPKAEFARRMGIQRQRIIFSFYRHWRETHPQMRMFNAREAIGLQLQWL